MMVFFLLFYSERACAVGCCRSRGLRWVGLVVWVWQVRVISVQCCHWRHRAYISRDTSWRIDQGSLICFNLVHAFSLSLSTLFSRSLLLYRRKLKFESFFFLLFFFFLLNGKTGSLKFITCIHWAASRGKVMSSARVFTCFVTIGAMPTPSS